jgi:hypothetical protein
MKERWAKVPLDDFTFGTCAFQQFNQNQLGKIIGFPGIGRRIQKRIR